MRRLLCALLVVAGCEKAKHEDSTKQADALWALAPANMQLGIVVTPRGVGMLDHAWQDIRTFMRAAPELVPYAAQLDAALVAATGSADFSLAAAGLTADKGAAIFAVDDDQGILVVPLANRDVFLAKVRGEKGTVDRISPELVCKPFKGVYACAEHEQLIDKLGTGKAPHLDARGDIEVDVEPPVTGPFGRIAGALQPERGGVVVRGTLHDVPGPLAAMLGQPISPRVDAAHTAGFIALSLAGVKTLAPPLPLAAGVTLSSLAQSLAGPMTITFAPGAVSLDARLPLLDPAPARTLIDHCAELLPLPGLTAKDGMCSLEIPPLRVTLAAWIDKTTLHIGLKDPPKPSTVALSSIGSELARGTWNAAVWGRGTLVAIPFGYHPPALDTPPAQAFMRLAMMLSEVGAGARVEGKDLHVVGVMRTAFANPDDVVAKLATIPLDDILAGHGAELAKSFAGTATPLAADLRAGSIGIEATFGVIGAIMAPTMISREKRTKRTAAAISLEQLSTALKRIYAETGSFPIGTIGLTPGGPCCQRPTHECDVDPKEWARGPWQVLEFQPSEPKLYQYSYQSDGKTAEIDAVADLDCDGTAITYRLKATSDRGAPQVSIEEPAPNSD